MTKVNMPLIYVNIVSIQFVVYFVYISELKNHLFSELQRNNKNRIY